MKEYAILIPVDKGVESVKVFDVAPPQVNADPYKKGFIEKHLCEVNIYRAKEPKTISEVYFCAVPIEKD